VTEPIRILLVEDSPTDAKLVIAELRRAGHLVEFERVEEPTAMRAALETKHWDAIICDWSMPRFSALGALELLKASGLDLPFVIVSGTVGEELAVEAMRAGAHDYVLKDKLARLAAVVERELREQAVREAHRSSEAARRAIEARFSRLAESGIIGIVIGDMLGNIIEANEAFLKLIGFTRADLEQGLIRWRDITAPESADATNRGLQELIGTGVATPYEKEYIRKDGSRVSVLVGLATLSGSQSIGFMVDLTAQKSAESALRNTQEQLRHTQKMEAVGRLAGGVAHDFNNLLSVVLSYCSFISDDLAANDPMRADLDEIRKAGERAADLTRQLLAFSRQQVVEPRIINLNEVLSHMDKMLRRLLGEDIDVRTSHAADLGRAKADPGHVEQVIMNLVVNARDAMPDGGTLTIETANVELDESYTRDHLGATPGPHVMFAVSDTGSGMDKATQQRIFEPFFTTKEKGKGTGLGLSTVFGIVQQSGGSIWVYSELDKGTTFKVYLPRTDEVERVRISSNELGTLRGSETILLVEDDDQVRLVARGILKRNGYRLLEARNGGEALLTCERHKGQIDLLLTDVVMPQMSGRELAERLLQIRPDLKVLYMSGYTEDAILHHRVVAPGVALLQKPLTPDTVLRKVRAILDRAHA
jgi:two-component system, cell cycle sensor histidine kinase and response regulator CckA